jgi:hypothetical protein
MGRLPECREARGYVKGATHRLFTHLTSGAPLRLAGQLMEAWGTSPRMGGVDRIGNKWSRAMPGAIAEKDCG